ncbi:ribonuclease H-like domain-containing protein, partial [Tanacetum coccineum]
MTQKLGNGFESIKKSCFVCGSSNHLIKDCDFHDKKMGEPPNKFTHPHPKRNFVPTSVVTKSGQVPVNTARVNNVTTAGPKAVVSAAKENRENDGNPQYTLQDQGIFDSGCSRYMTGNKSFLTDYQEIDGRFVAFGRSPKEVKLLEKTECLVLSPDFKLLDESQVLLKVPRQNNMYSFDLKNVVPSG